MSESKLTVIIPVYNRASILERSLDSVAAQTLRPLDIVIVDNNSTDESAEVIEHWIQRHVADEELHVDFVMETKAGATAARNAGLAIANTPIVMFFDSDDEMHPDLTDGVIRMFDAEPALDIVCWEILIQRPDRTFVKTHRFSSSHPFVSHIIHSTLATQRYAVKKEFIERVGGWNDTVKAWNDFELGVRLLAARPVMGYLDGGPWVKTYFTPYSITDSNPTTRVNDNLEHALDCCEENLVVARRPDAGKWIDFRRAILAADYARGGNKQAAHRLLMSIVNGPRLVYRLLYYKHRLFPRGTHMLAPFARC